MKAGALVVALLWPAQLFAFPPYRSTDADTAAPWTLETRLGLLRVRHDGAETAYSSPLLRLNLGLPGSSEIVSEFEQRADDGGSRDAAVGFKYVPVHWRVSAGVETLALLPVADGQSGTGVESQLLATLGHNGWLAHVNAGGFYDARPASIERGWRASTLVEFRYRRWRPGFELFARRINAEPVEILAGPGLIVDVGRYDIRLSAHAGLTDGATDLTTNLWVATKFVLH
jgi:hypothetical protein